jgi:hypothetical protein
LLCGCADVRAAGIAGDADAGGGDAGVDDASSAWHP